MNMEYWLINLGPHFLYFHMDGALEVEYAMLLFFIFPTLDHPRPIFKKLQY